MTIQSDAAGASTTAGDQEFDLDVSIVESSPVVAELVVITELLHAATRSGHLALAEPLRRRASLLLGRAVPALV